VKGQNQHWQQRDSYARQIRPTLVPRRLKRDSIGMIGRRDSGSEAGVLMEIGTRPATAQKANHSDYSKKEKIIGQATGIPCVALAVMMKAPKKAAMCQHS